MQENEFEKKVQQRMEELRFRPSDAVWEHVEKELRRRKKRRVVIFTFLLAGLTLLGYSGYHFFYSENKSIADSIEQNSTPALSTETRTENRNIQDRKTYSNPVAAKKDSEQPVAIPGKQPHDDNTSSVGVLKETPLDEGKQLQTPGITREPEGVEKEDITKQNNITRSQKNVNRKQNPVTEADEEAAKDLLGDQRVLVNKDKEKREVSNEKRDQEPFVNSLPEETIIASVTGREEVNQAAEKDSTDKMINVNAADSAALAPDSPEKDSLQTDTGASVKSSTPSKKKLKWGVEFSVGMSETGRPVIAGGGTQNSMDAILNPFPLTPNYAAYVPPMPPSSINPGMAFKLGPTLEWQITRKSSFTFGLQYLYASTRTKIGEYIDTSVLINNYATQNRSVGAVYRGYRKESYSNSFHFAQIPVSYQLQLNRGFKTPLLWNAGVSAGYLVATNAVLYDTTAGGIYYKDNKAFNRFQFNLHTGFAIRFGVGRKMQWSVGPEFSMGASKLVKDAYNKKQYLFYSGLTGRLIFSKKK